MFVRISTFSHCFTGDNISQMQVKLNCHLKFSPWSANLAIFFSTRRNSEMYVHFNMTITPPLPNEFLYAFYWHPLPKSVRTLWMPVSAEYLSKKTI